MVTLQELVMTSRYHENSYKLYVENNLSIFREQQNDVSLNWADNTVEFFFTLQSFRLFCIN